MKCLIESVEEIFMVVMIRAFVGDKVPLLEDCKYKKFDLSTGFRVIVIVKCA